MNQYLYSIVSTLTGEQHSFVAMVLLKATLVLTVAWLFQFALRNANAQWRAMVWRICAVCLIGLPLGESFLPPISLHVPALERIDVELESNFTKASAAPVESLPTSPASSGLWMGQGLNEGLAIAGEGASPGSASTGQIGISATEPSEPMSVMPVSRKLSKRRLNGSPILAVAYAAIVLLLLIRLTWVHLYARRLIRRSAPAPDAMIRLRDRVALDLHAPWSPQVRTTDDVKAPLLVGVRKPVMLLPEFLTEPANKPKARAVFAHELAHIRSHDHLWRYVLHLIGLALWFHPLAWRIRSAHADACEEISDAVAAAYVGNSREYSLTLIQIAMNATKSWKLEGGIAMAKSGEIHRRLEVLRGDQKLSIIKSTRRAEWMALSLMCIAVLSAMPLVEAAAPANAELNRDHTPGPQAWVGDLSPISPSDWNEDRAAHLLERAGFGGTPEEIKKLAKMTPAEAVDHLVDYESIDAGKFPEFEESGIYPNGHMVLPIQEVAPRAMLSGKAFGIKARREGDLPLQPGVDEFYTLLVSESYEMRRAGQWWAQRMLVTPRPFEEKLTFFWHDHFATSQSKILRYKKMIRQIQTLRDHANGNFKDMLVAVAQDPAMLIWLDNRSNVKGKPNENFAREIMELFAMGEGQGYSEEDIREMARAFTGWTLTKDETVANPGQFKDDPNLHDDGKKSFLGESGNFTGYEAIDIILKQPATSKFMSGKLYRYFVREDLSPEVNAQLAKVLTDNEYAFKPLLKKMFLSKDFYSPATVGTQIKGPVHLVISTYRKLGITEIPGIPDFNSLTENLGELLFFPPNVAGWPGDRSWINPATLLTRGNFAHTLLFPPSPEEYGAPDKVVAEGYQKIPLMFPEYNITPHIWNAKTGKMEPTTLAHYDRYLAGLSGGAMARMMDDAEKDDDKKKDDEPKTVTVAAKGMPKSKMGQVAAGEQFNLAVGVYTGFVQTFDRVKPIPRTHADIDMVKMAKSADLRNANQAVDHLIKRFLSVPLPDERKTAIVDFLNSELNGTKIDYRNDQLETALRRAVHLILSAPEYQLG